MFLDFGTGTGCQGGTKPVVRYRNVVFELPEGGRVAAPRVSLRAQCGLDMSEFGLPARYGPLRARPGTPGTLRAVIHLRRIRAGAEEVGFTVTLGNPTATPVRLRPCPGYTEAVYARDVAVHRSFRLDCDSVREIPARGHVRYAMRLALPRGLVAGPVKLSWNLDTPNGPFAGRGLVVAGS